MEERLQKFISASGVTSRRKAEEMITSGQVKVNGKVVTELGTKVTPNDIVTINNEVIHKTDNYVYYMLNKPEGYVTSTEDDRGRKTVMDLVKGIPERIYPVGRLDYDTSGLLLFTNDGDFMNLLLKPATEIQKEYHVTIKGLLRKEESKTVEKGVDLGDLTTKKSRIYNVKYNEEKTSTSLDIVITEGKNREIRRMFDSVNHEVKTLKRMRFGNVLLDIQKGTYRRLRPYEIKSLKLLASTPRSYGKRARAKQETKEQIKH